MANDTKRTQEVNPAAPPPPLGDVSTRRLVALILMGQRSGHVAHALRVRHATLDDVRRELRRRELTGVGVQP